MKSKQVKEYVNITIGLAIIITAIYFFLIPQDIVTASAVGLATLLATFIPLPISLITFFLNVILLIVGFIFVGGDFGWKTVYATVVTPIILRFLEIFIPVSKPLFEDIGINLIFGTLISSIGIALIFYQNACSGGTEVIAKIINKYSNIDYGKSFILSGILTVGFSYFIFGSKLCLISLLGLYINGIFTNYFVAQFGEYIADNQNNTAATKESSNQHPTTPSSTQLG
ncbi:YitT family protein [Velocimicrobium porci]|nr:YitT family protein [Velocimicrobium porci]